MISSNTTTGKPLKLANTGKTPIYLGGKAGMPLAPGAEIEFSDVPAELILSAPEPVRNRAAVRLAGKDCFLTVHSPNMITPPVMLAADGDCVSFDVQPGAVITVAGACKTEHTDTALLTAEIERLTSELTILRDVLKTIRDLTGLGA